MIPTKAKNVLLLPLTDGGITQPFNMEGHAGYDKSKPAHNGLDIGWNTGRNTNILACQDGTVKQIVNNGSSIGNAIVLQHDYADGTHRWTAYIHLRDKITQLKVGATVKQGDVIGIRGGSPYGYYVKDSKGNKVWKWKESSTTNPRYGVHLHLYVTKATTLAYTWNNLLKNVINPLPLLYRSKDLKYDKLVGDLAKLPYIQDAIPEVVAPVERDTEKNQLTESTDKLRVRMEPSLKGTVIGYLKKMAFYDWYDTKEADGYMWYQIAEKQWVAKTSTMTILPARTENDVLQEELEKLKQKITTLEKQLNDIRAIVG